jgi:hypothetical protein
MPTFYKGYSFSVYLAFVIFVAKESQEHPDPFTFALLFLTIWALLTILVGYQGVIHAQTEFKQKHESDLPMTWPNSLAHGIACGIVFGIMSLSIVWSPSFNPVYLGIPVFYALFGPGFGLTASIWIWQKSQE